MTSAKKAWNEDDMLYCRLESKCNQKFHQLDLKLEISDSK